MYRIFIVEDEPSLAAMMKKQLEPWGYEVILASDFRNVLGEFKATEAQLVLLDIMLPFYNGYHWCSEIRKISSVPVVFISSASDNMNIVMAMNMGGDDFISKPVDMNVMCAKIGAILRRAYNLSATAPAPEHRGAVLGIADSSLSYNGSKIELTKNELRILQTLMESKGKIVSRDTLMMKLWQDDCYVEENTLTVNVTRLRKKLDAAGLTGFITTKVGSGYIVE